MRQTILILLLLCCCLNSGLAQENSTEKAKKDISGDIRFEKTTHDFGKIEYNGNGTYGFIFENTGKEPLLTTRVRATCGCTVPTWPDKPILPGKKDTIMVGYNTRITGSFSKSIRVYTNVESSPIQLIIKGEVAESK